MTAYGGGAGSGAKRGTLNRALGPLDVKKRDPERGLDSDMKPHPVRTLSWSFQAKLLSPHHMHFTGLVCGKNEENGQIDYFLPKIQHFDHVWSIPPKNVHSVHDHCLTSEMSYIFKHIGTMK